MRITNKNWVLAFFPIIISLAFTFPLSGCGGTQSTAAWKPAGNQPADPSLSPEDVFVVFFEAQKKGDFETMAAVMHPDALESFREVMIDLVESVPLSELDDTLVWFSGVDNLNDLRALTPSEFFVSFLSGLYSVVPAFSQTLGCIDVEIIDTVAEHNNVVIIVYRVNANIDGFSSSTIETISLQESKGAWRVLLPGEIEYLRDVIAQDSVWS